MIAVDRKSEDFLRRVIRKTRRELYWRSRQILWLRPFASLKRSLWIKRRAAYAPALSRPHPKDVPLLEALKRDGMAILPVKDLGWPGTEEMLAVLKQLVRELEAAAVTKGGETEIPHARVCAHPVLRDWGASPRARAFVEGYLELPAFHGAPRVKREAADGGCRGVRRWHLDVEDFRVLKLILYLNDVEAGGGPFEYFSLEKGKAVSDSLGRRGGGLATDDMLREAGLDAAVSETARYPKHTAILVDAARILHRAQPPVDRDRYAVTFSWLSIHGDREFHPHGRVLKPTKPASD